MVWMMLEERKKLSEEKSELQQANDALQLQLQAKDLDIEALEVHTHATTHNNNTQQQRQQKQQQQQQQQRARKNEREALRPLGLRRQALLMHSVMWVGQGGRGGRALEPSVRGVQGQAGAAHRRNPVAVAGG